MTSAKSVFTYTGIVIATVILAVLSKLLVRLILSFLGAEAGEFIELVNTAVFIIVGGGFGFAVKKSNSSRTSLITSVILLVPLTISLFFFNSIIEYREWNNRVSAQQNISYEEAKKLTDGFLEKEVGFAGFAGYYSYEAKAFIFGDEVKKNPWIAATINWGIRIFYLGLSIFFIFYSFKEAKARRI